MDHRQAIADIETELDGLAESAERCRKVMLVAKVATATGLALLSCLTLGLLRFELMLFVAGVTAVLAGPALFGSHRSTLAELQAKIVEREAERAALIDEMDLRIVESR